MYDDKLTGTFGDIATSSFYPPHHITCGEGGMVYTSCSILAKILLSIRDWGRDCICDSGKDNRCGKRFSGQFGTMPYGYDHKYIYSHFGYNLKATEMQGAIGIAQLDKLPYFVNKRRENFKLLYEGLQEGVNHDNFILPEATEYSTPSWFGFWLTSNRDCNAIVNKLESEGIQTRKVFAGNILRQPCFTDSDFEFRKIGSLMNTDRIMKSTFWVGVYPGLTESDINYMIDILRSVL
jgi:CDP-6-deoxy-D-xylo-4-hexulose-3-dehydrase